MSHNAAMGVKRAEVSAVVTRCGCTEAEKRGPEWHAGQPCPKPCATEDLGVIAFWHRNPLRVLAWKLGRWSRGRKAGTITYHGSTP